MGGALLVLSAESHTHRRGLGALAWAALEEMALSAVADDDGWYMVGGVRDIGASMGVTKDTAARAVAVLVSAGLARRERLSEGDGKRRSAYRLVLPSGVTLCPINNDSCVRPEVSDGFRPDAPDKGDRHDLPDSRCPDIHDAHQRHHLSDIQGDAEREMPGCPGPSDGPWLAARDISADVALDDQAYRMSAGADVEAASAAGPGEAPGSGPGTIPRERRPYAPLTSSPSNQRGMKHRLQSEAQNAAQGQLFELDGTVTAASQDGPR